MMPSCDQTGVPIHFHSSTTSGSASLMSLRILPRVLPRQSPSSAILFEMSSDGDPSWLASDFLTMLSVLLGEARRWRKRTSSLDPRGLADLIAPAVRRDEREPFHRPLDRLEARHLAGRARVA